MSGSRTIIAGVLVLGLTAIGLNVPRAARGDQVWIEPQRRTGMQSDWYPRGIETRVGTVVEFDAQQLRFLPATATGTATAGDRQVDGGPRQDAPPELVVAATRVIWVEPDPLSQLEHEAMQRFAEGEYSNALTKLPEILRAKPPVWRQQWMTMMGSVAAWKSGRAEIALELVSQLDRRPLPPPVIAWLPIAWTNRPVPVNISDAAAARLGDESPLVQLVAASWMLSSPQRPQVLVILRQLESQPRPEIARFARILAWRTATPPEVIASSGQWETEIDSLPMAWQTGPLTLLDDKLRTAGQLDAANRIRWSLESTPIHPHFDWMMN